MRQKMIILPKLNRSGKQWFVYYSCRNPKTGKMQRFRHYDGFTGLSDPKKAIHAASVIEVYTGRLRNGWTPFTDASEVIYSDHIDYKSITDLYRTKRGNNNSIRVWTSRYLETIEPAMATATFQTYRSKFRLFIMWLEREKVADNDIATLDNKLLVLYFTHLINNKKLSKISITKYRQILNSLFTYFKAQNLIYVNPVYDLPLCNRINDQAPRPIMRHDIKAFKKEIRKDPELWLATQFEYYCGLRPGHEIREMKIKHIDFTRGIVLVNRERAKMRVERIVTVPQQLLLQLRNYYRLHTYNKEWYVFGRGGIPGILPVGKNKFRNKFNVIRKKLNMPLEYKFYSWKHTGAVEADEALIPTKEISRHLGHTSIKSTDYYFRNKRTGVSKAIRDNFPTL